MNNECENDDSVCEKQKNYTRVTHKIINMHASTNRMHVYEKSRNDESENDEQCRTNVAKDNYTYILKISNIKN